MKNKKMSISRLFVCKHNLLSALDRRWLECQSRIPVPCGLDRTARRHGPEATSLLIRRSFRSFVGCFSSYPGFAKTTSLRGGSRRCATGEISSPSSQIYTGVKTKIPGGKTERGSAMILG
jgi:hypothetical protein